MFKKGSMEKEEIEPYDPKEHGELTFFDGIPEYKEIERYWLEKPYVFVAILYNEEKNEYIYWVCEPRLDEEEKQLLEELKNKLRDALTFAEVEKLQSLEEIMTQKLNEIVSLHGIKISTPSYYKIRYYVLRDFVKFDRLTPLMQDSLIEDISCCGWDSPVFLYHKNYHNIQTNVVFQEKDLSPFVIKLAQKAGKHISVANPLVDATLPDGSRLQLSLGDEITTRGTTFTMRRFRDIPATPVDLIRWNTFSSQMMAYLWLCIENNKSLIFAGGSASGKTTSMNAASMFIPPRAKIVSIEDTRELQLPHKNWIPGRTRPSFMHGSSEIDMYQLLRAALRQRPEYILLGEVRGREALTLFQAMSTGHTTYSTMHADSVERVIHRLENPPISVPRTMIEALDLVSIQSQPYTSLGKKVRRCVSLVEILEVDAVTKVLKTVEIFKWDPSTDSFSEVGISQALEEIKRRRAWTQKELQRQLEYRRRLLEYLVDKNITDFKSVSSMIHLFQVQQDKALRIIGA
jgi:flagellar protein FlaI